MSRMSLFDDDFYSTKVSKRKPAFQEMRYRSNGWRLGSLRSVPSWLVPAASGSLATVLLFTLVGGALFGEDSPSAEALSGTQTASAAAPGSDVSRETSDSVVKAAAKVGPTVVSILSARRDGDKGQRSLGMGSGVIFQKVDGKARIVTNNHVVEGSTQVEIVTAQGERRKATLIGSDQITDLAVLEIDGTGIKEIAEFGDSEQLKPGETAIAIGNPLGLGYSPTITRGIISWPKRTIPVSLSKEGEYDWEMEVIQTDAAINQGNSGGALVNLDGKVVGINTLKVAEYGVEGLGFAIPINQVRTIVDSLIKDKKVKRPYMGVITQNLQSFKGTEVLKLPAEVKTGIIVIDATGPAKDSGLKTNDVIVELDGKPVNTTIDLRKYIYGSKAIGDKINIAYYRGGKKATTTLTLSELK
jgi:serine protease Do